MIPDAYFAADYAQARGKFLAAAGSANAALLQYPHPLKGPGGEDLATDIAWLGPRDARRVVVVGSATHGVEGYCGSGCQTGILTEGWNERLPADTALVLVHANNPHGFAHDRRVNEDNIDLNRNFIDFEPGPPANPGYRELHPMIVPEAWDGPARAAADSGQAAYIEREGYQAFQQDSSQGQYEFPDGIFYGGTGPSWSRRTVESFAAEHLAGAAHIALVDFHTGLGPRGYGEIIGRGGPGDPQYERTRSWYGDEVRSAAVGDTASVRLNGTIDFGYRRACPNAEQTAITLEFGTVPHEEVHQAIRADNWLYARGGGADSPHFTAIKRLMREAFYGDDSPWKQDTWTRGQEIVSQALVGVSA